jgi:hypothetical protein
MADVKTPQNILDDKLFKKAYREYIKLPEVHDDTWYCTGIQHLVYWAQHEIDLIEEGERQNYDDECEVSKSDQRKLRNFIKKWRGIKAEHEGEFK